MGGIGPGSYRVIKPHNREIIFTFPGLSPSCRAQCTHMNVFPGTGLQKGHVAAVGGGWDCPVQKGKAWEAISTLCALREGRDGCTSSDLSATWPNAVFAVADKS